MLVDLRDVLAYTDERARNRPIIASRISIRRRGELGDDLPKVSRELHLPPIYKMCLANLGMFGVSIGYFNLWPGSIRVANMVDALYKCNGGDGPVKLFLKSHHLIEVASDEANLICVGAANHDGADIVHYIDAMSSPTLEIFVIAPDFEKFLILAANLNKITLSNRDDPQGAASLMAACCEVAKCTGDQAEFWTQRAIDFTS